jgi:hypothetical protein
MVERKSPLRGAAAVLTALGAAAAWSFAPSSPVTPPSRAHAQTNPTCASLTNPIYIAGSSASRPLLREAQRAMTLSSEGITIVYLSTASCDGPNAIINDMASMATANYFTFTDPTMPSTVMTGTCTLGATGVHPDIGVADVAAATCGAHLGGSFDLASTQREVTGPIQSMNFVVPAASTETSISAEAAYVVMGFGGMTNLVNPWNVPAQIFNRVQTSGTQIMIGAQIGLLSPLWQGNHLSGSGNVVTSLTGSTSPANAIGILASDVADANRSMLHILAFQGRGQSCGYLPDSSSTATDKVNVREGRYAIWGPIHYTYNVDAAGHPAPRSGGSAAAMQRVLDFVTLSNLAQSDNRLMITAAANASTVPACAMHVTRTDEASAPVWSEPSQPCHCLFESLRGTPPGRSACATCTTDADCTGGTAHTCRFGFCEEH